MDHEFIKNGSTLTVRPAGRMDTVTSPLLHQQILSELEGITELILDLERVDYLSSGGLRVLLALDQEIKSRNGNIKLLHVNEYIREVFEITGFLPMLTIE